MSIDDNNVPKTSTYSSPSIERRSQANKRRNWGVILGGITCGVIFAFIVCTVTGVAAWKSIDLAQKTAPTSATTIIDPDLVIGLWNCPEIVGGQMEIKSNTSREGYIGIQASSDSTTSDKGEIILEFGFNPESLQFEGRHLWGGGKSTTTEWGKYGGVVMELRDANTLFVRFLDSIYSEGWVYTRVN